jgi:hypothetical protein
LPAVVLHDEPCLTFLDRPGRREAAGVHGNKIALGDPPVPSQRVRAHNARCRALSNLTLSEKGLCRQRCEM